MGIVLKQSFRNTLITYLGFGIGGINTIFLYTNFLSDENYGLVSVIVSIAVILTPIISFGVPNSLVKYYSSFKDNAQLEGFLTLMLLLPLVLMIPLAVLCYFAYDLIGDLLAIKNSIVKGYVWYMFIIGVAMSYFEIFYAWSKVHLQSVFGNFLKEVFIRVGVMLLLVLFYFDIISLPFFLKALVGLYLLRTLVMKLYAYTIKLPRLRFSFPRNTKAILSYTSVIIVGGSVAVILLEVDKFMINQYIEIKNVAYYTVAAYIATVIAVPARAMHQITYPLTAEIMNKGDKKELLQLYQKSSLTLFIAAGLLFVLILINLPDLYEVLPTAYRGGFTIVFLIGIAKVYDSLLGNNNAILYNSEYYRALLLMGVFLAAFTILCNLWLIPEYGINGAAIATLIAIMVYNTIKMLYIQLKFKIHPFTKATFKVMLLLLVVGIPLFYISLPFHAIVNIVIKSSLVIVIYVGALYRFNISEDISKVLSKFLTRKTK